jgi:hypothetical protein
MTEVPPYDIKGWRLVLGLTIGSVVAIVYFMAWLVPAWHFVLVVGAILAVIYVTLVGFPLYLYLRYQQMLNIYVATLLGGLLTTLPDLMFTMYQLNSTSILMAKRNGTILISDNKLTSDGWWHYFFWEPLWFLPAGLIGGLVAWIVAIGFHVRPRRAIK